MSAYSVDVLLGLDGPGLVMWATIAAALSLAAVGGWRTRTR